MQPPAVIVPGKWHRFPGIGKPKSNKSGYCKLFPDGLGGAFGDWSSGFTETWQAKREKPFSVTERDAFLRHVSEAKAQADAELLAKQADSAATAKATWEAAQLATDDHPYLIGKGIKGWGLKSHNGELMIPVRDGPTLHSIQFIDKAGKKQFLTGGRVKGCRYVIGDILGAATVCIAEGYATGATIHEVTGYPVAIAFNAGNLEPVALALREELPDAILIVCADDDAATEGNPGLTKAKAAAQLVNGHLAIPDFGGERPKGMTDFNDLSSMRGAEAVRSAIANATQPAGVVPPPERESLLQGAPIDPAPLDAHLLTFDDLIGWDDPLPHYVDKWIPEDEVTLLAGHGGGGKSYVALILAVCVALGLPFAGLATRQAKTLFYSGEDGNRVLRKRLLSICHALKLEVSCLKGKLHLLDASDLDPALHREQRININGRQTFVFETPMLEKLSELVGRLAIGLVVIDNASDAYDDDEIKRARVRGFVRSLRTRIARPGRAVLLLAHINKASANHGKGAGSEDYSGSTAWHNSVRSRLSLIPKDSKLTIEHAKANLGPKADSITLEWQDGVPVVAGTPLTPGAELAQELVRKAESAKDDKDKAALVELIGSFGKRGERVTTSMTGSSTVYKLLNGEKGFPKQLGRDRLNTLLRQLETEGQIYRSYVKTPDRKLREVFTCTPPSETAPMLGHTLGHTEQKNVAEGSKECAIEA